MIIVKLMGGLGNQMFQYAAGRALAEKHGVPLRIDTSFLEADPKGAYTKRNLELNCFALELETATASDLKPYVGKKKSWQRFLQRKFSFLFPQLYFAERGQQYQEAFETLPSHCYLDGFWQNETYFTAIKSSLQHCFVPKGSPPQAVQVVDDEIRKSVAVSLHVRRGDYITQPGAAEFHGVMGMSYYKEALALMKSKVGNYRLFIFSDDMAWCRQEFGEEKEVVFVEHTAHAVWDLWLMSRCKHHIIANSSFSWWGAWLGVNAQSQVIMPKYWHSGKTAEELGIKVNAWLTL